MNRGMNADQFKDAVGRDPEHDDLDRANCKKAGELGHHACGICADHKLPVFECAVCFPLPRKAIKR